MSPMLVEPPDRLLPDPPAPLAPGAPPPGSLGLFRLLNRAFMVPLARAGLGAWVSTPVGGAILLLRVRGRRSGVLRETPLNYVIDGGSAWVLAGFGPRSEWYRNLVADGQAEVLLPGRRFTGTAVEVRDPAVRRRLVPAIVRSTPAPSLAAGIDPWRTPGDELEAAMAWVPLIRLDPDAGPLFPGPDDPGGLGWVWRQGLLLGATVAIARAVLLSLRKDTGRGHASS